jgi:zinc protease
MGVRNGESSSSNLLRLVYFCFSIIALLFAFHGVSSGSDPGQAMHHYSLDNGMDVVLVEVHSAPLVSAVVRVEAGVRIEEPWQNGITHFLEHLLFNGTARMTQEELYSKIDLLGAYVNAYTRENYTAFEGIFPKSELEKGLHILREMLFNSIIPQEKLSKEKGIVIEEIKKSLDMPWMKSENLLKAHLYEGTPLSRPVLGGENIIEALTRRDILEYYHRHYVPQKMTLIVVGDFQSDEIHAPIARLFEPVAGGPGEVHSVLDLRPVRGRAEYLYRENQQSTILHFAFPAPPDTSRAAADFILLAELLAGSDDSHINKAVHGRGRPLAYHLSCAYHPFRKCGYFVITAITSPSNIDALRELIVNEIAYFSADPPDRETLARTRKRIITGRIFDNERFNHFGRSIAEWIGIGTIEEWRAYPERLSRVSPASVQAVSRAYLNPDNYLLVGLLPNTTDAEQGEQEKEERFTTMDMTLENGMRIIVKEDDSYPIQAVHVLVRDRAYLEPQGKAGIGEFTSRMLLRGAGVRSFGEIQEFMARNQINVTLSDNPFIPYDDYYTVRDYSYVRVEGAGTDWKKVLELTLDLIADPTFPVEEIDHIRTELHGLIRQRNDSGRYRADDIFHRLLFGDHPFHKPLHGSSETVSEINRDDLLHYHRNAYAPDNLIISAVISEGAAAFCDSVSRRFEGDRRDSGAPDPDPVKRESDFRRGAEHIASFTGEQATLRMGIAIPGAVADETASIEVLGAVLSHRLAMRIREELGLSYSIGAGFHLSRGFGVLSLGMGTRPGNLNTARREIREIMEELRSEPVGERELREVVNAYCGRRDRYHQRRINQAYYLGLRDYLGTGFGYDKKWDDTIRGITAAEVLGAARTHLLPEHFITVILSPETP